MADFQRDYALEAQDDWTRFAYNDLGRYYLAEYRIEQAWNEAASRQALFREYGIRNEQHFYQIRATIERYVHSPHAAQTYGGVGEIMHIKMNAVSDYMKAGMQQRAQPGGELADQFQPVEGVSLQDWARYQAKLAGGGDFDQVLASAGIDRARWERVSAEWNARMARDTTLTIATAYGQAFTSGAGGSFGQAAQSPGEGQPPIPLEKYVEAMEAQNAGAAQGKDATQILQSFGLSIIDWSNVSTWWSAYLNANMLKNDAKLYHEYTALSQKYAAKYRSHRF
jgi:hypothetical protein